MNWASPWVTAYCGLKAPFPQSSKPWVPSWNTRMKAYPKDERSVTWEAQHTQNQGSCVQGWNGIISGHGPQASETSSPPGLLDEHDHQGRELPPWKVTSTLGSPQGSICLRGQKLNREKKCPVQSDDRQVVQAGRIESRGQAAAPSRTPSSSQALAWVIQKPGQEEVNP